MFLMLTQYQKVKEMVLLNNKYVSEKKRQHDRERERQKKRKKGTAVYEKKHNLMH